MTFTLLLSGCSRVPPLEYSQSSAEALAREVLTAFDRKDAGALQRLALNEREFRDHVWPELPAARPERNLPFSFVWGDLRQKSEYSLQRSLAEHGRQRHTLVSVRFEGETTRYPTYVVHRDTVLTVRNEQGGTTDLRLFGSSLEKDGAWKVFSYVVD